MISHLVRNVVPFLWVVALAVRAAVPSRSLVFDSQTVFRHDDADGFTLQRPLGHSPPVALKARPTAVYRPRSLDAIHHARMRSLREHQSEIVEWDKVQVPGPDVEDLHTLDQLARMTGNAYALPGQSNWYEVDSAWNRVSRPSSSCYLTCSYFL
jgi:lipase ATG15